MQCQRCNTRPAAVRVRRTAHGRQEEFSICNTCAEELGIRSQSLISSSPLSSFFDDPFFGLGGHDHAFPLDRQQSEQINILDAFSDRAKGVLQRAAEHAMRAGSPALDTEHLLIAVAEEGDVGRKVLEKLDINADELIGYLQENMAKGAKEYTDDTAPDISPRAKQALELAWHAARNLEHDYVGSEHILIGLLEEGEGLASQTIQKYGVRDTKLRQAVLQVVGKKGAKEGRVKSESTTPTLDQYSRDLTQLAREGKLDPVIGRGEEVQRVIQILSRRRKNNPVLIGEPGIGKTAIAEGLATRIVNENIPDSLKGKRVLSLDIAGVVAGSKFRGISIPRIYPACKVLA